MLEYKGGAVVTGSPRGFVSSCWEHGVGRKASLNHVLKDTEAVGWKGRWMYVTDSEGLCRSGLWGKTKAGR